MPAILKRRKIRDTGRASARVQTAIANYARVSKEASTGFKLEVPSKKTIQRQHSDGKERTCLPDDVLSASAESLLPKPTKSMSIATASKPEHNAASRPRKRPATPPPEDRTGLDRSKRPRFQETAAVASPSQASTAATPTRGARSILEAFALSSSPPRPIKNLRASSKKATVFDQSILSEELQDLNDLHQALLQALALHFAHHGTAALVPWRSIISHVERVWRRRRVSLHDLQRALGVQDLDLATASQAVNRLRIVDCGQGNICLEFNSTVPATFPLDSLRERFQLNLIQLHQTNQAPPLAPLITDRVTRTIASSKGAQRLASLDLAGRSSQQAAGPVYITPPPSSPSSRDESSVLGDAIEARAPQSRAASLLERIRVKESEAAKAAPAPSQAQLDRRAALMRLEEVVPVLDLLASKAQPAIAAPAARERSDAALAALLGCSSSSSRSAAATLSMNSAPAASFTLDAIVQHLQMSLRNPISRHEVERCIHLAAEEVLSGWLQIRQVGSVTGVVMRGRLTRQDWMGRISRCLGQE